MTIVEIISSTISEVIVSIVIDRAEEAKEILKGSDMEIYFSDDLPSAAQEINKRLGR